MSNTVQPVIVSFSCTLQTTKELKTCVFVALRGAATLKARALKEVWNIAAVIPVDRGVKESKSHGKSSAYCEELLPEENFLGICNQELLARGSELLKRTRNGNN